MAYEEQYGFLYQAFDACKEKLGQLANVPNLEVDVYHQTETRTANPSFAIHFMSPQYDASFWFWAGDMHVEFIPVDVGDIDGPESYVQFISDVSEVVEHFDKVIALFLTLNDTD